MNRRKYSLLIILIGVLLVVLAACGGSENQNLSPNNVEENNNTGESQPPADNENQEPEEPPMEELVGNSLRGGLIYDKWWVTCGLPGPEEDHPLWATQDTNTRDGDTTWRCKECHGWDYKGADGAYGSGSHFTGFPGVIQLAGGDPHEILAALTGQTNADHDFSSVMSEQDLTDLALFIAEELVDYSQLVGEDKMALSSDTAAGDTLFEDTCAACHGPDGRAINFGDADDPEFLGDLALGNPWEVLHKTRFGQPGTPMPSVIDIGWSLEEQGALLAYVQTLIGEDLTTQGGLLWDKWWSTLGIDGPTGDNPLWATQDTNTRDGDTTWRCKECHGWDYMGADGAYGSGSHFTGFPGVFGTQADVLTWLNGSVNPDHDFSMYLDEAAMNMLAAFIQDGMIDMSTFVNEDKSVNGDPAAGQAFYKSGCASCHGEDGQAMNFGDADDPEFLGDLAAGNPWETIHKAANGQPGSMMPSAINLGWSWQDIADVVAYLQTLAAE
jgi:thiosulfate dehydrogenase